MKIVGRLCRCIFWILVQTIVSYSWLTCNSGDQSTLFLDNQTFSYLNETTYAVCPAGAYDISASENNMGSLTEMSFKKSGLCAFYSLRLLQLTNNRINSIGNGTFSCFRTLSMLNLSHNSLTTLPQGIFDGLNYLTVLDLSFNSIQTIDVSVFGSGKLDFLTHVNMQNNDLLVMEPWAYVLRSILLFDLRNNSISNFSNTIGWKYDLREPFLTEVDLRYNNMTNWRDNLLLQYHPEGDPNVDLITYNMDLRENPWKCDCYVHNVVSRFQSTFFLHVRNELTDVKCQNPYQLHGEGMLFVRRLKELVCNITVDCPENCLCQKQPENQILIVDCNRRGLSSLPQVLPSLPPNYTYALDFSYNSIRSMTKRPYLDTIQTLDMEGNGLQEIESTAISETQNLKFIDLKNNKLKSIPNTMQKIVFEMTDLSNNPFVCDCDMIWMAGWIERSPMLSPGRSMKCTFEEQEEFTILEVTSSLLDCTYDLAIGLAVGFGVLLIIVLIVVIWTKRCPYETKVLLFRFCGFHPRDRYIVDRQAGTEFDAYVSFDDEDIHIRQWVLMKLAARLEPTYKMFIPIRDLPVGADRSDETMTNLEQSKRVIIVLSDSYDEHEWCQFECQRAEILDFNEGRIIYIRYHESVTEILNKDPWKSRIGDRKMLSPGGTKSERRWFWDKLKYELPIVRQKDKPYCFSA
ncbi:slit homolog 2 protein-like [Pecten maximus]|uniref:slit homolog 2 protein-like n=1 Tax=Pecten maximus TaxID=6579 RepID=UPI0014589DA5|nr:slit homolog 2 protein-like [Pecten maximus]